jgi:uncharacterized membrane protein YfcA
MFNNTQMTLYQILILIIIGLLAGFLSGTMGVGGGLVIVPSLVFILGMSQHLAQGTSLAMMLAPIGIMAVYNYFREGYVNIKYAIILALAFILGAWLGSLFSVNLTGSTLKKIFGVLMLLVGLKMITGK